MNARSSAWFLACAACTGAPPPEPVLELGGGGPEFAALAEGDRIPLVSGPQGGWHVDVGLRCTGLDPDGLQLSYSAHDASTLELLSFITGATLSAPLVELTEDGWDRLGDRVVFDIGGADEVVAREVRLEVLAERGGEAWLDSVDVQVVDVP
ncbi:MAG: hypothetical protein R3F61_30095 [Myxococcota bacterium]